jgi:hypothetical protein
MRDHDYTATIDSIGEGWTDPAATVDRWNVHIAPVLAEATTDAMRAAGDEPLVSAAPGRAQLASEWAWEQFCAGEAGEDDGAAAELAEALRTRLTPTTRAAIARFYVYTGPACNEWIDYDSAEVAMQEHPGEPVFDRTTKEPVRATHAAIVNDHGQVVFSAVVPAGIGEVSVAGAVTTGGAPVNVRYYRVSRSKRNLGAAADGWEVPQLTARSHQGEVFYQEVRP